MAATTLPLYVFVATAISGAALQAVPWKFGACGQLHSVTAQEAAGKPIMRSKR